MAAPKQIKDSSHAVGLIEARAMESGRRAYVRYPVVLDATIVASQGRNIACAMRDFCMGGMLLQYKWPLANGQPLSIATDDLITVNCLVPDSQGDRLVEFQARVARTGQDGVGIAFIDPDQESLQIMQRFAVQFSSDAEKSHARKIAEIKHREHKAGALGRRYKDIIIGCERIVQEAMDSLLEQVGNKLAGHLFDLSRDARDSEGQNDLFGASEILRLNYDKLFNVIRSTFQERLKERIADSLNHKQSSEKTSKEIPLEKMSLVGDEDLGAWLAISEMTNKVEEKNKEALAALEERLSVVFAMNINHVNNPYGPALFAESFQAGLGEYKFKESVNVVCYTLVKEILIPILSGLYERLNNILIEYGILPKLKYKFIGRSQPSHDNHEAADASPIPDSMPRGRVRSDGSPPQPENHHGMESPDSGVTESLQTKPTTRKDERTKRPSVVQDPSSDLYQLIQNLRELRQEFSYKRAYVSSGNLGESAGPAKPVAARQDSPAAPSCYSTSELVDAVADLQAEPRIFHVDDDQVIPIKSRVLAALNARNHDDGDKNIGPRDNNVLEVAGDLLSAVQNDPLVAVGVKPWLKQLELPVLKLALQDPSLFFDQTHVVRQVVNNIAQLEFYHRDGAAAGSTSIGAAIESLLEKIALERSDGMEIFFEIQARLDKLVRIQNLAFAENLKDLVKACEENTPIPEVYDLESVGGDHVSDSEMHKWMMFARRLKEGDEVLFSSLDSKPQRLRVAWIDARRSMYVFVNLRGIKERVMGVSDVARMIRLGIIQPQGNAADPAMDRAQYSIMQNLYKQVVYESTHDSLTGLINRREFSRRLDEAVTHAKRSDKRHVLVLVDIDQFSAINSSCGYGGGDKLLQDMIEIIGADMDGKGEVARVGPDVFAILLNECSLDDALALAERQIEDVANYKLAWDDHQFSITLSIGIVPISARSGSVDELMQAAESSCRIAKDAGGNRLQVFHAGYTRVGCQGEIKKWAAKIDKILEEDGLEIRCQRIEPVNSDGLLRPHYEILLGVKDEHGNIGSPVEFIKGAEMSHKMSAVDRYVISTTLAWMNANAEVIENFAGFTINLSGESLNEEGFMDFILTQLQELRVPYEKICFEVTETVGISNLSDASLMIEQIKDTGCRFALDDFGSGMSSYGYLKNLPVDIVKIDGAFVKELVAGSSDYAVVKSITEIAHFMKKKVVAEFVDSNETLDLLREIGVDYVQGYMIDKPGSLDRLVNI